MGSWDDSDNSNSETEKKEANIYLMINSDTEEVNISNFCQTWKEMEIMFGNLLEDSKCLTQKCLFQKEQILNLKKEKEELEKVNDRDLNTITNLHNAH